MQITFTKNIQFSKLIKANGRLKEFNFRKMNDHKEGMFTVDVVDERDSRVFFNIQKIENNWKIIKNPLQTGTIAYDFILKYNDSNFLQHKTAIRSSRLFFVLFP